MGSENLTYSEYGARQPSEDYEGELPLTLSTEGGNVLVTDANGVEIVPFTPLDFEEGPGVEMVPAMTRVLKKYYEDPESLIDAESDHLEGRLVYGDSEGEEDYWFDPASLPSDPAVDDEIVDRYVPFSVVVDDNAEWPDDVETKPDHEIRIEDADGDSWYRIETAACDAMYTETTKVAKENAADLIEAVRLAYERPAVFIARHQGI
jgi:hypothetical protein